MAARRRGTTPRSRLPDAAFLDRTHRRFPMPTRAQARAAGMSERQRAGMVRNAPARAAQSQPSRQPIGKGGRKVRVKTVTLAMAQRRARTSSVKTAAAKRRATAKRRTGRRR